MSLTGEMKRYKLDPKTLVPIDACDASAGRETLMLTLPDRGTRAYTRLAKGARVGEPCTCIIARAIMWSVPGAKWAHVHANVVHVLFADHEFVRYKHNGLVPKALDNCFYPDGGEYRLSSLPPSARYDVGRHGKTSGPNGKANQPARSAPVVSMAARMRA